MEVDLTVCSINTNCVFPYRPAMVGRNESDCVNIESVNVSVPVSGLWTVRCRGGWGGGCGEHADGSEEFQWS